MSRILVTGATGFLGRFVVDQLLERGHEVVALVRRADDEQPLPERVQLALGDILNETVVATAAAGCDGLFHCAGKVSRNRADAEELHKLHVEGTRKVLDAGRKAGVRRAVVASTSGTIALSSEARELNETAKPPMRLLAKFPYYRSKYFAEEAALERNDPPNFEVVLVNPTLLLGPGDHRGSSTSDVADFIEGRIMAVPGGGLSFVDARDAAVGMVLAFEKGRPGERYLLAAQNLTTQAFCEKLERVSGIAAPKLRLPRASWLPEIAVRIDEALASRMDTKTRLDPVSLEMAQLFWYVDSNKARSELDWEPRDPTETLADTVSDLRSRGVVWS
jgi:dihydroflavonol-4-reductase